MKKIPVKIVQYTMNGKVRKNVMLDMLDTYEIKGDVEKKVHDFKQKYFGTVEKALKIMPENKKERKASHFWKVGRLLHDFNKSTENEFEITNYNQAIIRDFGLYDKSHVGHTLQFGQFFTKKDISDSIPMSTYLELIWKASVLEEQGLLANEKKRLLKLSKNKILPPHKKYRVELNHLISSLGSKKKKDKKMRKYQKTIIDF
jgi:hypothetical protein